MARREPIPAHAPDFSLYVAGAYTGIAGLTKKEKREMEFRFFNYTVTIERNDFDIADPETWPRRHQRRALRNAEADCAPARIPYIKAIRYYAFFIFGESCGLKSAKKFIDKRYPELPISSR